MKKILIFTVVAMAFGGAFANESSATNAMDMAARKAAASKRFHERTGGFVVDVQKTKGGIYFVNAAGEAFSKDLAHAAQTLQNDSWLPCKTATAGDVTIMNINEKMSLAKWNVAIVLVSNDMLPMTIIQPEGRWAFINIEALKKGNPSEKILSSRVKKSALRAAAFVFGCGYSLNAGGIATPIAGVEGLDACLLERLPVDVFTTMQTLAPKFGITMGKRTYYRNACLEGWAPPPANKYQEDIWKQVHSIPDKPMKIEFDPKRDKDK